MEFLSTIAIVILSVGFWSQVLHIHKHKEVRDISIVQYVSLFIGYSLLAVVAQEANSTTFLIKQLMSIVPTAIIIGQIIYHRQDKWEE